jgi:hypothetical protein
MRNVKFYVPWILVVLLLFGCSPRQSDDMTTKHQESTPFQAAVNNMVNFSSGSDAYMVEGGIMWCLRGAEAVRVQEVKEFSKPNITRIPLVVQKDEDDNETKVFRDPRD